MEPSHLSSETLWLLTSLRETQSLTESADKLQISIATAMRRLVSARNLLGDPLFVRSKDGLLPTARMLALYPKLRAVRQTLIDLAQPDRFEPETLHRTIRVAGVDNAGIAFLLPCLRELYERAPNLRLSFLPLTEDFPAQLERGDVDLVFFAPPKTLSPCFHEAPLFDAKHVIVVRKGHPLTTLDRPLTRRDLQPYREIALTYGTRNGLPVADTVTSREPAMDCGYFLLSACFLLETDFFVSLPRFTALYLARFLPLAVLEECVARTADRRARLIWHHRTQDDPALQWFRSVITKALRGHSIESSLSLEAPEATPPTTSQ